MSDPSPELPPVPLKPHPVRAAWEWARAYVTGVDPKFWAVLAPLSVLAIVLYSRLPSTNYIFDEQEAILANPYVNAVDDLGFWDAIHRDFWGLPHTRSVGSYRPIPNFIWRALWSLSERAHPDGSSPPAFLFHFYNVVLHAVNATLLTLVTFRWTGRRGLSWLCGVTFVTSALLTEAVTGIVGIADVLGGLGALCALYALSLPGWAMPFAVFTSVLFGLFAKESALVCVPLVPFVALLVAPLTHPTRPMRWLRALAALVAATSAFVLYVELRKVWFPAALPAELEAPLPADAPAYAALKHDFLVWFHQPSLPRDPLNNPLADADTPQRIGGALRVYLRGLGQVVFPWTLSGDYSKPAEPAPETMWFTESVAGAVAMVAPLLASVGLWLAALVSERRARRAAPVPSENGEAEPSSTKGRGRGRKATGLLILATCLLTAAGDVLVLHPEGRSPHVWGVPAALGLVPFALLGLGLWLDGWPGGARAAAPGRDRYAPLLLAAVGLTWLVVAYFPHSNIPVVLPTVRAERFWYFPVIGSSLVLTVAFAGAHARAAARGLGRHAAIAVGAFLMFQAAQAYRHTMDYRDDLTFWGATKDAVPRSAKAHLNYSVMKGARRDYETRLVHSRIALELAPEWPMAHIYTGDVLCRMGRPEEAWPYYVDGFRIGENEIGLIALALQCLWDTGRLYDHEDELRNLADELTGSWFAYLAIDTLNNGSRQGGVDPKHRPRGYNEGPKEKRQQESTGTASAEASEDGEPSGGGANDEEPSGGGANDEEPSGGGANDEGGSPSSSPLSDP